MDSTNIQKPSNKRTRQFSIMTYVGEKNIQKVLYDHSASIRSFAYIYHDRDETTNHHHLVIRTYDAWTSVQVNKWFDHFKLEINENTMTEPASDLMALKEYLIHADAESIKKGKFRYSEDDIIDGGLFVDIPKKDSYDETYEIINAMLQGAPTKQLVRRYGKQFIYHFSQFTAVKESIEQEEWREEQSRKLLKDRMPYGWRTYNAPSYASAPKVTPDLKPIPLDNMDIDDFMRNPPTT